MENLFYYVVSGNGDASSTEKSWITTIHIGQTHIRWVPELSCERIVTPPRPPAMLKGWRGKLVATKVTTMMQCDLGHIGIGTNFNNLDPMML